MFKNYIKNMKAKTSDDRMTFIVYTIIGIYILCIGNDVLQILILFYIQDVSV